MGAEQSITDLRSIGQVDGKPVEFKYDRDETHPEDLSLQSLSFRLEGTNDVTTISGLDIIAVIPVNINLPKDYFVLYVQPPGKSVDSTESSEYPKDVTLFKSLIATTLPQPFIHAFHPSGLSCWQLRAEKSDWPNLHIIISTKSGACLADSHYQYLVKPLLSILGQYKGKGYEVHHTTSERSITEFVQGVILPRAKKGVNQAMIILSGDGGVIDVVNALFANEGESRVVTRGFGPEYVKPNIALLPMGTGNALANSTGLTKDRTLGLSMMLRGVHRNLPIFRVIFSPGARLVTGFGTKEELLPVDEQGRATLRGAVVCSWGLHATLVADSDTEEYRKFGAERFGMAAKEALSPSDGSESHRYNGKVSVLRRLPSGSGTPADEGTEVSDTSGDVDLKWELVDREEHAYVLLTLVSNLEASFTISPNSKPLENRLWLVHFGPMPGDKVMEIMGQAYLGGKHVLNESVNYEEVEGLRIELAGREDSPRWRRFCVDGKIVRLEGDGWLELRKETLEAVDLVGPA